jgi:hypothetical protein
MRIRGLGSARKGASLGAVVAAICAALACGGCAAPGEPIARHSAVPVAISDLRASQQGNSFLLSFTVPSKTTTKRNLPASPSIEIYRTYRATPKATPGRGAVPAGAAEMAHPELLVEIPAAMVSKYLQRGKVRFAMDMPAEQLAQHAGQEIVWIVRTQVKVGKQSDDSNVVSLPVFPVLPPPQDVEAKLTQDAVVVSWVDLPPAVEEQTAVAAGAAGMTRKSKIYRVYRAELTEEGAPANAASGKSVPASPNAEASAGQANNRAAGRDGRGSDAAVGEVRPGEPAFVSIGESQGSPFRDTHFQFGRHYVYSVRTFAEYEAGGIESADSNLVKVDTKDVFVPAAPTGLVAIPVAKTDEEPAHVELSWAISPETDLAGYNVYRVDAQDSNPTKMNDKPLLTPTYRDMSVAPARAYTYSVTAIDRAGNESPQSASVSLALTPANQEDQ